ncbi:hypothetical protein V5O48_018571, partial [Marasmius crinis-equi]
MEPPASSSRPPNKAKAKRAPPKKNPFSSRTLTAEQFNSQNIEPQSPQTSSRAADPDVTK